MPRGDRKNFRRSRACDDSLVPSEELAGLKETAHLLRSSKNAKRLLTALHQASRNLTKPETVDDLRREFGI
jgi:antitoxin YefM